MPATSKAQWKLMKGIAEGSIPPRDGITKKAAQEFIRSQPSPKGLPAKKASKPSRKKQ